MSSQEKKRYEDEISRLRMVLQQRENEILILLNMVDKNKSRGTEGKVPDTDKTSVVYNPSQAPGAGGIQQ